MAEHPSADLRASPLSPAQAPSPASAAGPSQAAAPVSPLPPSRSMSPAVAENTPFTAPAGQPAGQPAGYAPAGYAPAGYAPAPAGYPPVDYNFPSAGYGGAAPAPAASYFPYYGAAGAAAAGATAAAAADDEKLPKSFRQRMAGSDRDWQWKMGLRLLVIVLDLVAIGCVAYVTNEALRFLSFTDSYDDEYLIPYALITIGLSLIWCVVVVLVHVLRRPPRPPHPGFAVGFDLVLWLAFIVTILLTAVAYSSMSDLTSDDYLSDPSGYSNGYYTRAPNGTWVYQPRTAHKGYGRRDVATATASVTQTAAEAAMATAVPTSAAPAVPTITTAPAAAEKRAVFSPVSSSVSSFSYDDYFTDAYYTDDYYTDDDYYLTATDDGFFLSTSTDSADATATTDAATSTSTRHCYEFDSCAQQDAFIINVLDSQGRRMGLALAATVLQGIVLLLHFVLFVWACVDTNRYNRNCRNAAMTLSVLQDFRQRGYVMVPASEFAAATGGGQPPMPSPYPRPAQSPAQSPAAAAAAAAAAPVSQRAAEKAPERAPQASMPRYS